MGALGRFPGKSSDPMHRLPADAVSIATIGEHNSMIVPLLDRGQDIEREGLFGTPLRAASLMGHESNVWMLLHRDAKADVFSSLGDALQASAVKGHVSIAKMLIKTGQIFVYAAGSMKTPCRLPHTVATARWWKFYSTPVPVCIDKAFQTMRFMPPPKEATKGSCVF